MCIFLDAIEQITQAVDTLPECTECGISVGDGVTICKQCEVPDTDDISIDDRLYIDDMSQDN